MLEIKELQATVEKSILKGLNLKIKKGELLHALSGAQWRR